ncbi:MAG TPA: hypothetical protein PKE45_00420 [Caldilineaceae bacterium]|nr:hypothetical protein [Caldilineaceae bacterium]
MFMILKWRRPITSLLVLALALAPILSQSAQAVVAPQAPRQTVVNHSSDNECLKNSPIQPASVDEETAATYKARFLESNEFTQFATTLQEGYAGKFKVQLPALSVVKLNAQHTSVLGVVVGVDGGAGSSSFSEWFDASGALTMTIASIFDLLPDGNTIEASIAMNGKPYVHAFVTAAGKILSGTIWHDGKIISLNEATVSSPHTLIGFLKCIWDCLSSYVPPWYLALIFAVCAAVCTLYQPACYWCFFTELGAYLPRFLYCWTVCRPQMVYLPLIVNRE